MPTLALPGPDQIPVPAWPPWTVPALTTLGAQLLHDPTPHIYTYLPPSTHLCSAASTQLTLPPGARCTPHSAGTTALRSLLRGPAPCLSSQTKAGGLTPGSSQASTVPLLTLSLEFHLPLTLFWLLPTHAFRRLS